MAVPTLSGVVRDVAQETLSERAVVLLEHDILNGVLKPGDRLAIAQLAAGYGISQTPLREGLTHLAARGLIVALGQRGFRVASVSRDDLADITRLRILLEREALKLSIGLGNDEWEAGIIAAMHRFRRAVERAGAEFREGSAEIDRVHKDFHTALIAGCGSQRMLQLHSDLYDQAYRYRRLLMRRLPDSASFIDEHQALADVVLARTLQQAEESLAHHLRATLELIYGAMA